MLGAATVAPALPVPAMASATQAAAVNRFTYGMALFRLRHGGAYGASDLARMFKLPLDQATGLLAQMTRDGFVRPSGAGMVQAVASQGGRAGHGRYIRKAARQIADAVDRLDAMDSHNANHAKQTESGTDAIPT